KFKFMIKSIKLLSIGFLGALAMSSCSKEDPTPEPKQKFTIEFSAGENGTVDPKGSQTGEEGTEITSKASPTASFSFAGWFKTDDPENRLTDSDDWTVKDNELTVKFTANTANKNFIAKFAETLYKVTFKAEAGGSVDEPSGESSEGSYVHSTAKVDSSYNFAGWWLGTTKIESKDITASAYVSEDGLTLYVKMSTDTDKNTYEAKFTPIYTVNFKATAGGTINKESESAIKDKYIEVKATANTHYTLDGWYDKDGIQITSTVATEDVYTSADGSILYVKSLLAVNKQTFTAKFTPNGTRIYVKGTGDAATLELTKDPTAQIAFFQFGSVVAWSNTGAPQIVFNPTTTISAWNKNWGPVYDFNVDGMKHGQGDPCKLVGFTQKQIQEKLAANELPDNGKWRTPTEDENVTFTDEISGWTTLGGKNGYYMGPGAKEGETCGEFFPTTGWLEEQQGALEYTDRGYFWSNTQIEGMISCYYVIFTNDGYNPEFTTNPSYGMPVRCIPQQ
ncbi:MAG: InlB B-repeat-containing protein, partial [Phocaeicola sp.]